MASPGLRLYAFDEERLPLAFLLGATKSSPALVSVDATLLQHSSCIMYYWLFCAVTIYVRCMVRTTTALFLYCSTAQ